MALLNVLGTLTQALPYIRAQYKGKDLSGQNQAAGEMSRLAQASYNPDDPLYKKLYAQNREMGQQDLASTISELSRQNRKLTSMGRTPLLDQERGGETVFRNLMRGYQDVGNDARGETVNQLRGGLEGQKASFGAQGSMADRGYDNKLTRANAYYGLGGLGRTYNPQTGDFGSDPVSLIPQAPNTGVQKLLKALFGL